MRWRELHGNSAKGRSKSFVGFNVLQPAVVHRDIRADGWAEEDHNPRSLLVLPAADQRSDSTRERRLTRIPVIV